MRTTDRPDPARRVQLRWLVLTGVAGALAGCGFRLQGQGVKMAFSSLRLNGMGDSAVLQDLRAQLRASGVQVFDASAPVVPGAAAVQPDVVLDVLKDQRERVVVGSTAAGQVRELQLRVRWTFRLRTPNGKELIAPQEMLLERDLSFTETQVLGKEMEEALLYRDMENDVVRQVMRRLASVKGL